MVKTRKVLLDSGAEGVEIFPAPTLDNLDLSQRVPGKNEITFQIKCKSRNFCRNWKRKHVKKCMYCRRNFYHLIPMDGFGLEDNYDPWIPDVHVLP